MKQSFNIFTNGRFARTEPREWRHLPWRDDKPFRINWKYVLFALGYVGVFYMSLWFIAQQVQG